MYLDKQAEFSDAQAVGASGTSARSTEPIRATSGAW